METSEQLIERYSRVLRLGAAVSFELIRQRSTKTTLKSVEEIIRSDDISGFFVEEDEAQIEAIDGIYVSALIHRKMHAHTWFCTALLLPRNELSTNIRFYCTCPFNSKMWCSHVIAIMLMISNFQLNPLEPPSFDSKGWRPSSSHPLSCLGYVRELSLPWIDRAYIICCTDTMYSPDRRRGSLGTARPAQTYQIVREKPKKRGRRPTTNASSNPAPQTVTTSWTRALQEIRQPSLSLLTSLGLRSQEIVDALVLQVADIEHLTETPSVNDTQNEVDQTSDPPGGDTIEGQTPDSPRDEILEEQTPEPQGEETIQLQGDSNQESTISLVDGVIPECLQVV